ncbi:MAG: threonine--tRNA ligase [Candidatus Marsarchaeota archaeon]|nr:threonine--tRNA ligase [Candidatus Marsarchaeota archaeon]
MSDQPKEKGSGVESEALNAEKKVVSTWFILNKGKLTKLEEFDLAAHTNLKKFAEYEAAKVRAYKEEPPHIRLMREHELVDYEPESDRGNMRFYPNGRLVKSLLERFVTEKVVQYGAVEVETPIMYNYDHPALKAYLHRFPARHYTLESDEKEYFLRFSADFGQFLLVKDAQISYRNLPFRFYELTRYSFRKEQSGELVGLKRLRSFTMPDMHTLCPGLEEAKQEFVHQFRLCSETLKEIGIREDSYEMVLRLTKQFYDENTEFVLSFSKIYPRPVLVEMWNFRYAYFDPKFEFNFIDEAGKASSLSTVQIDHENAERYGITYTDASGSEKYPIILHTSPSGAIERVIYALLESAHIQETTGDIPGLPVWLSPAQVRLIPVAGRHVPRSLEVSAALRENGIRSDVDDTDNTVGRRVRRAEEEWVPYVILVGDRELHEDVFNVRIRYDKVQLTMSMGELIKRINAELGGKPRAALSLSERLSKRPKFFK